MGATSVSLCNDMSPLQMPRDGVLLTDELRETKTTVFFAKGGGKRVSRCEVKRSHDGRVHRAQWGNERVLPLPRFITCQGGTGSPTHNTDRANPSSLCAVVECMENENIMLRTV